MSYILGEVLIDAYEAWYKTSIFKLFRKIKKAKFEFEKCQEILKSFKPLSAGVLEGFLLNKALVLKHFKEIQRILHAHSEYEALLDVIFKNFAYFVQNLDLIKDWLNSSYFSEKYKKQNHPYPSLLDPKKLNDESEEINYTTILPELAWNLNLPLPERYEFVVIASHGVGSEALKKFFTYNNIASPNNCFNFEIGLNRYTSTYYFLLNNTDHIKYIHLKDYCFNDYEKFCKLIQKQCKFIFQIRDYIEILTCYLNHRARKTDAVMEFDMTTDLYTVFDRFYYFSSQKNTPIELNIDNFKSWTTIHKNMGFRTCIMEFSMFKSFDNILDILYVDMKDIIGTKTYSTMKNIFNFLSLKLQENKNYQEKIVNNDDNIIFPLILDISKIASFNNVKLTIIAHDSSFSNLHLDDITKYFNTEYLYKVLISKKDKSLLNNVILQNLQSYFSHFTNILKDTLMKQNKIKIKESEYINIYLSDKTRMKLLYDMMDYELTHIKQNRPDIVASWKHYTEFKKICEKLDETNTE